MAVAVCMAISLVRAEPTATTVTLDSSVRYQTIEGLGGAICFYNGWYTAHPYKQEIYDLAFSGLNLSMLRVANWWRGVDGQDREIYEIVEAANQRLGRPVPILMSSWSPPAYLKSNGEVGNGGTLIQIDGEYDYAGFADYWYYSLLDYRSRGVNPTWITIQNEPDWTASYDSCRFDPTEDQHASYALAQEAVFHRLQELDSPPKLLSPDCVGLYGNASALRNYMAHMNPDTFYGIAHHLYGGSTDGTPDGYIPAFNTVRNTRDTLFPGKPIFMTEFGDIKGLVDVANLIHNSLAIEQVSGYNHWCLIWPGDIGLIEIEFPWGYYGQGGEWTHPKGYWINPSYWSMKHYSYYVQPGFRRVKAESGNSNVLASAYLSPDHKRLVAVFVNRNTTNPANVTLNPGSFAYDHSRVFQTVGESHFQALGPLVGQQLELPAESVTTVVLDHFGPVAPTDLCATQIVDSQINLGWTAAPSALSYNIKRSTSAGGPYSVIASNITTTSFCDAGVEAGQAYYYVVSSNAPDGESVNSAEATVSGVRAYLRFDETGGSTAYDATGNGWNGTLVNGPLWTDGKFGNAVSLAAGSNGHVTLPNGVVNGLSDFTIATWVYLNTVSDWSRLFDFGTGQSVNMFLTPRNGQNGAVRFAITTGGAGGEQRITGSSALPTGAWTHVAVTLSDNTGILYVNGAEVGRNSSMSLTPSSLGNTTQNYIGRSQYPDPYLNGRVDEFRIYTNALSPAAISLLYAEDIPTEAPLAPTGLSVEDAAIGRIDLAWNPSVTTTNYTIKRSTADGGPYAFVTSVSEANFSDTGLPEKTTYYYVVSAVNSVGQSDDSAQISATTPGIPPAAPSGLTVATDDGWIALNWQANTESDLAGYNVYRSTTPGSGYVLLNEVLLGNPEFTDYSAAFYTTYYYIVTAVDFDALESEYSIEVEAMSVDSRAVVLSEIDFEEDFGDWVNGPAPATHNWLRHSGTTPTPMTGPASGADNSTWYAYMRTSLGHANSAGNNAILESPVIYGLDRVLMFHYHMFGNHIGTLNVDVYDGQWHNGIWSLSGQQHAAGDDYSQALVDLRGFTGPIRVRLRAVAAGGGFGDIAIDEIELIGRYLYGDMNGDGIVDIDDLADFAVYWLQENDELDLTGDGRVGLYEFAEFTRNWLYGTLQ